MDVLAEIIPQDIKRAVAFGTERSQVEDTGHLLYSHLKLWESFLATMELFKENIPQAATQMERHVTHIFTHLKRQ